VANFTKLRQVQTQHRQPDAYDAALDILIEELSFGDRTIIAKMKERDLENLDVAFRRRIKVEFGLGNGNKELLQSCCSEFGQLSIDLESVSAFIIKGQYKTVQDTRVLKVVK
jgi:hypothetical protein